MPEALRVRLDRLLLAGDEGISPLQGLKEAPGQASPHALLQEIAKLTLIEETGILELDIAWVRDSLRKMMARRIRHSDAHRVRALRAPHRYTALVCFLHEAHAETIDTIVEMHAKLMTQTYCRAQNRLDEKLRAHRKALIGTLESFRTITHLVLSGEVRDQDLRSAVLRAIPAERLEQQLVDAEEWLTGSRSDVFPLVRQRFSYFRQFSPTLLRHLAFEAEPDGKGELVEAIRILHGLNEQGKRKVPEDAPVGFLTRKIRTFVETETGLDRAGYEFAVLMAIRDEIRRGNLWVRGSRRYGKLDDFFMPDDEWDALREPFFALAGLPADPDVAVQYLKRRLGEAYDRFLLGLPKNTYVEVSAEGAWCFGSDLAEQLTDQEQQDLSMLTTWLEDQIRRIRLPDLLIEVDNELLRNCERDCDLWLYLSICNGCWRKIAQISRCSAQCKITPFFRFSARFTFYGIG